MLRAIVSCARCPQEPRVSATIGTSCSRFGHEGTSHTGEVFAADRDRGQHRSFRGGRIAVAAAGPGDWPGIDRGSDSCEPHLLHGGGCHAACRELDRCAGIAGWPEDRLPDTARRMAGLHAARLELRFLLADGHSPARRGIVVDETSHTGARQCRCRGFPAVARVVALEQRERWRARPANGPLAGVPAPTQAANVPAP